MLSRRDAIKAVMAMPSVATISRASLKPTDVIVLESEDYISQHTCELIQAQVKQVWPDHKCIVLDKGLRLRVVAGEGT